MRVENLESQLIELMIFLYRLHMMPSAMRILLFFPPQVSWIRKSDLHVLTSGALTFTGDARFAPRRARDSDVHTLQIRWGGEDNIILCFRNA